MKLYLKILFFILATITTVGEVKSSTVVHPFPVEDRINKIQILATDRMIMQESGFLEVFANNDANTPVYYDNMTVTHTPGRVLEINTYYPYGMIIPELSAKAALKDEQNWYKFSAKELETALNLNMYDFGARMYDPAIGRWWSPDPLAEKYYSLSPYAYAGNNPIRYIDPTGLSYSEFDEDGNYLQTIKDNWFHNTFFGRTGRIVDGDGNVTQSFKFADPKNDVNDLKNGTINRAVFVQESEIISMLSKAGAFTEENKTANSDNRYEFIKREGTGSGKFDFSYNTTTGIPNQYPGASTNPLARPSPMLFLVDGKAYNHLNYGNFLFGAAGRALGLTLSELQMGAHYNSLFNSSTNDYRSQFDSRDDQYSIQMGVRHANKYGYKSMYYGVTVGPLQYKGYSY